MRYEKGHKEATRQKIVETAATEFRRNGIDGIGVADLMARTGLTHGGFYSHFKSKEELVQAALEYAGSKSRLRKMAAEGGTLEEMVRWYLSPEHCGTPERGCVAAALVAEIGRHSTATRKGFTTRMKTFVAVIQSKLPPETRNPAPKAMGIFSTMMGALQLARSVNDTEFSNQILQAGIEAALNLAKI
jgi:TetR/AcrR family transcriptional repressor of nem operon